MDNIYSFILIILLLGLPFVILKIMDHYPKMQIPGNAFWCYLLGVTLAMTPLTHTSIPVAQTFFKLSIPFALPFFIFSKSSTKRNEHTPILLKSFFLLFMAVLFASIPVGYFFSSYTPMASYYAGMIAATYIGGTINMASLNQIFSLSSEDFLVMNASDTVTGGVYLLILLSFMPKLCSYLLKTPPQNKSQVFCDVCHISFCKKDIFYLCILNLIVVGLSFGLTLLFPTHWESVVFFVFISIVGYIVASKVPPSISQQSSAIGNYLLMTFCICVGTQINFHLVANLPWYVFFLVLSVLVITIIFHLILGKIFNIPRDPFLVSHTAGIYGPAFIAPITQALNRPDFLLSGLGIAVFGNITGNYVGILVQKIVALIQ